MAKWIDDLRNEMSDDERAKNDANARKRREADLIAARAPEFFGRLKAAFQRAAKELNEVMGASVGEVTCVEHGDRVVVSNAGGGNGARGVVTAVLNQRGEQVEVHQDRKGQQFFGAGGVLTTYSFRVDGNELVHLVLRDPESRVVYTENEADEFAEAALKPVFNADLRR